MPTLRLKTNLRCGACVAKIQPAFDSASEITRWSADLTNLDKILTVEGPNLTRNVVENLLQPLDYKVLGEVNEPIPAAENPDLAATKPATYFPLLLILTYLLGATALLEIALSQLPAYPHQCRHLGRDGYQHPRRGSNRIGQTPNPLRLPGHRFQPAHVQRHHHRRPTHGGHVPGNALHVHLLA